MPHIKYDMSESNGFSSLGTVITEYVGIITAIVVIIIKNPVSSILFLIGLFLCISSDMLFLGLNFIALSYLIVYVGAVSILFLFILMLINIRISELISYNRNSIPIALIMGLLFIIGVYGILPQSKNNIALGSNLSVLTSYNRFNMQTPHLVTYLGNLEQNERLSNRENKSYNLNHSEFNNNLEIQERNLDNLNHSLDKTVNLNNAKDNRHISDSNILDENLTNYTDINDFYLDLTNNEMISMQKNKTYYIDSCEFNKSIEIKNKSLDKFNYKLEDFVIRNNKDNLDNINPSECVSNLDNYIESLDELDKDLDILHKNKDNIKQSLNKTENQNKNIDNLNIYENQTELNLIYSEDLNKVSNLEDNNVFSISWDTSSYPNSHIISLGNILYTNYPMLLILTSLILLLSMVGCIIITMKT